MKKRTFGKWLYPVAIASLVMLSACGGGGQQAQQSGGGQTAATESKEPIKVGAIFS